MTTNPLSYEHVKGEANYMSEQEANRLIQKYDKNGDAILTREELISALINNDQAAANSHQQQQQIKPKAKEEQVIYKPPQKVEAAVPPPPLKMRLSRDEMREILLEHDIDGDGYLTRSELMKAMTMCGSINSFHKASYALNLADADGDGSIDMDELEKVLDYMEKLNKHKK